MFVYDNLSCGIKKTRDRHIYKHSCIVTLGDVTQEPNDMDALESVTLIQKLEKAQTESYAQQKQISYYTRQAEVVYIQGQLEEERKAFNLEVEFSQNTAFLENC